MMIIKMVEVVTKTALAIYKRRTRFVIKDKPCLAILEEYETIQNYVCSALKNDCRDK